MVDASEAIIRVRHGGLRFVVREKKCGEKCRSCIRQIRRGPITMTMGVVSHVGWPCRRETRFMVPRTSLAHDISW